MSRLWQWALAACLLGFFLVFPMTHILARAFVQDGHPTLAYFFSLARNPILRDSIFNSAVLAVTVTLLSTAIALPYAALLARRDFPFRKTVMGLMMLPMLLPPFVGAIAYKQIFSKFGSLNLMLMQAGILDAPVEWHSSGFWGVALLQSLHLFPILYFSLVTAFSQLDTAGEEAAATLGGRSLLYLRHILFPQLRPSLFAGMSLVFVWAFTDLGTPLILEYRRVVPYQIFTMITEIHHNPMGYSLTVVLCVIGLGGFWLSQWLGRRSALHGGKGLRSASPARVRGWKGYAIAGLLVSGLALASLPLVVLVVYSFSAEWFLSVFPSEWTLGYYGTLFDHRITRGSIQTSLFLASLACLIDMVLGWWLTRLILTSRGIARAVLESLVMLPLALPGIILAFGYVGFYAGTPLDPAGNPLPLLIAGYSIRRLPFMVRALASGYANLPRSFDEAAESLGQGFWGRVWRIHLPLLSPYFLGAGILVFAFSMLEVSDSLILAMEEFYYPITKAIYFLTSRTGDGTHLAAALGVVGTLLLAVSLWISGRLMGEKMGEMFRAS